MKRSLLLSGTLIFGAILYNYLFWGEKMGLNSLIFTSFLLGALFLINPEQIHSRAVLFAAGGTFATALLIVWHNSQLVKTVHFLSLFLLIGFSQARVLRFFWFGLLLAGINLVAVPGRYVKLITEGLSTGYNARTILRWAKLVVLPIGFVLAFFKLYYLANPKFAEVSQNTWKLMAPLFNLRIETFKIFSLIWGFLLVGAVLLGTRLHERAFQFEAGSSDDLTRKRKVWKNIPGGFKFNGLKSEYRIALIAIGMLNGLLLVVNLLDLRYVWLHFGEYSAPELSQFVHQGTYLLIIAIFCAMAVMLIFFRRNLNFYPDNEVLKYLAYVWLAQNAFLTISVGIRNYHYIASYGLAYKRLQVLFFLLLVLFGLFTLFQKIWFRKSVFFLLNRNAWVGYLLLVTTCFVNWDLIITRYNLDHAGTERIDMPFLLHDVSDKNLFLLLKKQDRLEQEINPLPGQYTNVEDMLQHKVRMFTQRQDAWSWKSWNWADERNRRYLKKEKGR